MRLRCLAALLAFAASGCTPRSEGVLTFSGSVVGREGQIVARQIDRYQQLHPSIRVEVRATPDAADQRHQLYVQWLNAWAQDPDVLQLDVIWTPEFAAAGWIASLDTFHPEVADFLPAAVSAGRWRGSLYALPWFVDVGMLYYRTDLVPGPPRDLGELTRFASGAGTDGAGRVGLVWQGARYEGLVTVFLEYLGAYGGRILDDQGRVVVDSGGGVRALTAMRDAIYTDGIVPEAVLTWQEEQTRFAFQNGQALFMRNWPYAVALMQDAKNSAVAGRVGVTTMPGAEGGQPTAALGGSVLAINAHSDQQEEAYRLVDFLLQPEQMVERAKVAGQFPPRLSLYRGNALKDALPVAPADALAIIRRATPRPVTPVYSQLSEMLQVSLHRALTRQQEPSDALRDAATSMRALLARVRLGPPTTP